MLSFTKEPILQILQKIETQTDYIFNYDPALFKDDTFSGQIALDKPEKALDQLLYATPYTFEKVESTFLLYLPEPKEYFLCGTVRDQQDHTPLAFVNIFLEESNKGNQTDENGNYEWTFTAYKNQMVQFSYVGYTPKKQMVQDLERSGCINIELNVDAHLFSSEIIVSDYILDGITEGDSYSSVQLDYELLRRQQSIVEQDVLKNIQLLPGISSLDESATNLQIRGSTPDQNLIVWEDVTLYNPGHIFGMISAINPFVVEQVKVFKGVFDPQYDNRVGGIVDLSLSDSVAYKFQGGLGTTLSEAHTYFNVPLISNKLSCLIAGRKTINGLWESPTLTSYSSKIFQNSKIEEQKADVSQGNLTARQRLDYYDYNSKLLFQPLPAVRLSASWFGSHNDFNYQAELIEDQLGSTDKLFFNAGAFSSSLEIDFLKKGRTTLSYTSSTYENNYEVSFFETESEENFQHNEIFNSIKDHTFSITNSWQFNPSLGIQFGYNRNKKSVNFDYLIQNEEEPNYEDFNFSEGDFNHLYASFNYSRQKLELNGGLRATHFTQINDWAWSPRINAQYAINKFLKVKLAAGIFQQYISQLKEFGENELGVNNQAWILNDFEGEDPYIEARKISAGFIYYQKGWLIDVEAYYNKNEGLSTLNPLFQTSITLAEDYSSGSATSKGVDILLKKRIQQYTAWINYSLNTSSFLFPEIAATSFPASNDQRHSLSFINNWRYKNWVFSLSYQYRSGLPFSTPTDIGQFLEEDTNESHSFLRYEELNRQRLPDYSRVDIGVNYHPKIPSLPFQTEVNISVLNLLNKNNLYSRDFYLADLDEDEDMLQWFDIEKRLLKRTPLISVRLYW